MGVKELLPMSVRLGYRRSRDTARIAWRNLRCRGLTEADVAALYERTYHDERGYTASSEHERAIKDAHAEFIVRNTTPAKVLVAGCSAGDLLVALEERGVEAWGFDISPDLDALCLPAVRDRVRHGSMTAIPYSPEDRFDAVVATDVFEHVPRRSIPGMVAELARLNAPHLVTLIDHVSLLDPGHVTLMPLSWWRARLQGVYALRPERALRRDPPLGLYGLDPANPNQLLRVWDRAR